jgi:serine protease Do
MAVLSELQDTLQGIAGRQGPAVAGVGRGWGRGCGVVIGPGRVLTTARAARGEEVTVTFEQGRRVEASLCGADADLDLAVLAVDTGEIEPVPWDPVEQPRAGQAVVGLANPGGRGVYVTLGFIASVDRSFPGPRGRRIAGAIEHTAPLPRGSSGSPLLDPSGRLLGLNAVRTDGGLILAVHADAALKERVSALSRGEAPRAA